jgi:hypothetical protein
VPPHHADDGRSGFWLIVEDVDFRYILAAKVVDKEMSCQDDHWNDDYRTRPDVAWEGRFHEASDLVEFCGRPSNHDKELWINAYIEAEEEVIELRRSGHARARGILDLPNEMAYTCDHCRLWGFVGHIDKSDPFSEEERNGALFDVRNCDPANLVRIHGRRITADEAWAREQIVYDQEVKGSDLRRPRKRVRKEANRATTTS